MKFEKFALVLGILLHLVAILLADTPRHISYDQCCNDVVHVSARGSRDTIHYVYSSTGCPSVLIARASTKNKLTVNCEKFHNATEQPGSISFSASPDEAMVLVFTQLIEYVDTDNSADMQSHSQANDTWLARYQLSSAHWTDTTFDNDTLTVTFTANNDSLTNLPFLTNGSLSLQFHIYDVDGYGTELPHLGHNENTSQVDVVLDRLRSHSEQSRFAIELVMVADPRLGADMSVSERGTVDDEHSPGSFHAFDWLIQSSNRSSSAFLSWKPVAYTTNPRKVTSMERIKNYELQSYSYRNVSVQLPGLTLAYFDRHSSAVHVCASNVSFGGPKDALYYNKTQYIAWTFTVGLGTPITDHISMLVIIVVAIGLGIPFLLIVASGLYVIARRLCGRRAGYAPLSTSYAEIN